MNSRSRAWCEICLLYVLLFKNSACICNACWKRYSILAHISVHYPSWGSRKSKNNLRAHIVDENLKDKL